MPWLPFVLLASLARHVSAVIFLVLCALEHTSRQSVPFVLTTVLHMCLARITLSCCISYVHHLVASMFVCLLSIALPYCCIVEVVMHQENYPHLSCTFTHLTLMYSTTMFPRFCTCLVVGCLTGSICIPPCDFFCNVTCNATHYRAP